MSETATLAVALAATSITSLCVPIIRKLMMRKGIVDRPNHRSSHTVVTPRGGGIACLVGVLFAGAIAEAHAIKVPWPVIGAAGLLAIIGYLDDRSSLRPLPRLVAQTVVGCVLGLMLQGVAGALGGAMITVVIVNVVNFMDGINGITGVTMAIWGTGTFLAGASIDHSDLEILGLITAGAALGFLPWNAPRAKIFLGDVGSYLFGGLVAGGMLTSLVVARDNGSTDVVSAMAAPIFIYVLDVFSRLLLRVARGQSIFEAHREHVYQKLVSVSKFSHATVALSVGLAAIVVYLGALLLPLSLALVVAAGTGVAYMIAVPVTSRRKHNNSD